MNPGAVMDWLRQAKDIDQEIISLKEERQKEFDKVVYRIGTASGEKVQTSKTNTSEDKLIKYSDYSLFIDQRLQELYKLKADMMRIINKINISTYRILLIERYIKSKSWKTVAASMNYSKSQVFRCQKQAIKALGDILSKDETK